MRWRCAGLTAHIPVPSGPQTQARESSFSKSCLGCGPNSGTRTRCERWLQVAPAVMGVRRERADVAVAGFHAHVRRPHFNNVLAWLKCYQWLDRVACTHFDRVHDVLLVRHELLRGCRDSHLFVMIASVSTPLFSQQAERRVERQELQ